MNSLLFALLLARLPPEAHRLNAEAMAQYEAGHPEQALELFLAAYASVPADREQNHHREALLGSIRGSLIMENERSGAAAPLCRLRGILKAHVDSVRSIFADDLERPEVIVNVCGSAWSRANSPTIPRTPVTPRRLLPSPRHPSSPRPLRRTTCTLHHWFIRFIRFIRVDLMGPRRVNFASRAASVSASALRCSGP